MTNTWQSRVHNRTKHALKLELKNAIIENLELLQCLIESFVNSDLHLAPNEVAHEILKGSAIQRNSINQWYRYQRQT